LVLLESDAVIRNASMDQKSIVGRFNAYRAVIEIIPVQEHFN
jgi:hypothetical protein